MSSPGPDDVAKSNSLSSNQTMLARALFCILAGDAAPRLTNLIASVGRTCQLCCWHQGFTFGAVEHRVSRFSGDDVPSPVLFVVVFISWQTSAIVLVISGNASFLDVLPSHEGANGVTCPHARAMSTFCRGNGWALNSRTRASLRSALFIAMVPSASSLDRIFIKIFFPPQYLVDNDVDSHGAS